MSYTQHIQNAKDQNLPFVAFRNPNTTKVEVLVQSTDALIEFDDFSKSGYVFAPFDDRETAYILEPDVLYKDEVESFESFSEVPESPKNNSDKGKHVDMVNEAIEAINSSELSKVVIARKEEVELVEFDLLQVFNRLLHKYTNAYVYVWYHPKVGLWMGATPETLLHVNNKHFNTMALAGTQAFLGDLNPVWGQKELEEQQMVSDYIQEHLEKIVDDLKLSKVETAKSGNLLHLKTRISGEINDVKDVAHLVKLLHPTPAVCGLPKEASKAFILEKEIDHRSYYSGYLGALNLHNETSLYVNLRCFQLIESKAHIYIGGGITKDSIAEKEWEETVAKSQVIKSVL